MIRLTRNRTASAITKGLRSPTLVKQQILLARQARAKKRQFRQQIWKAAKPQLRRESAGKCGYCEGKASHVAHCDVEHIRPKSVYWWLAYCYDNFVLACQICNQAKSDDFPTLRKRL